MADTDRKSKPDFTRGISLDRIPDGGSLAGKVGEDEAILVRRGETVYAIGAHCTHYHGPLGEGLIVGTTVRCPWHHACFSLETGEPLRAPALDPVACWRVERQGDQVFAREKLPEFSVRKAANTGRAPLSIVIVGGGGAGLAAADMLRREGYDGPLTMLSAHDSPPSDRPNLSKDFLAGTAKDDWIPLRGPEFYADRKIDLVLSARVSSLDVAQKRVDVDGGKSYAFDRLLIATGAEPVHLDIPGAATSQVNYLRTFSDSKAIVAKAERAKTVVVIGASFIGLEVAASLKARKLDVHVVGPESQPLERIMGPEVGRFVCGLHEEHGVKFHLGQTVASVAGRKVTLKDGSTIDADFLVVGVGVRPVTAIAERAGLTIDRGIAVNEFLETSAPGIFAAGDVARWPDPHTREHIRVEHWVVAERMGQTAAKNLLGRRERFDAVPFFWSQHYDVTINYVGHAEKWDTIKVEGDLKKQDAAVSYIHDGKTLAMASVFRDLFSLETEASMERTQVRAKS
jgi:NADPH-dependent 2,4-dienoyl-CoA reductase/sulfur reductase-like enzyme/nitrite reductase/ring-hydroxylating ferredoxin subunit